MLRSPFSYTVADRAWRNLCDMDADQAVVVTGESGSGKTEAAKLVLQYLVAVTSHDRECHAFKYKLLQSNPVLEGELQKKWAPPHASAIIMAQPQGLRMA